MDNETFKTGNSFYQVMTKKSFQDILCELIAARISRSSANALSAHRFITNEDGTYTQYVELAKKIYNEQEPK
jgi:hypothetical protein